MTSWWPHALECVQKIKIYNNHLWQIKLCNIQWVAVEQMKNEANQGLKIRNKLVHPWWLTIVSFPFMGQPWKIITLSSIEWVSIEQKTYFWCENTTKKGWRDHATSPFLVYKISNSKPILLKNSQPAQGSQSVEICRRWIQHILQNKYN